MTQESRTENGATLTSVFAYDPLGQLTSFTRSDGQSETYTYDPVGNMTAKTQNGVSTTMRYNAANQLIQSVSSTDKITYSYDANGNLTRSENAAGARSYAYNALNLLESFTREDGYSESYSYNANRLLSEIRTNEDLTTTLIWDILYGDGVVISAAQNGKSTSFTYGLERISAKTGSTRTEYVYDGRGSVAAEVSYNNAWYTFGGGLARKNVVSKSYSPFGELLTEQTSGFGYNGEYYNAATGMIYLRARFYEPEMNRFGQKDTLRGSIADPVSLNRYLYCQSDPVNFADYNGLQMVNVCVADGGGSGRSSTSNQTISIVTKPGQNSVSYANAGSRTVAVPMTDTGTGGYSSAATAASEINPANDNSAYAQAQRDREAMAERGTASIDRDAPTIQTPTAGQGYSCGRETDFPNINALGAGDYKGISDAFNDAHNFLTQVVYPSIEMKFGIGPGIRIGFNIADVGVGLGVTGNYIEVRLDNGNWSVGQSFKREASLSIPTADFGIRRSSYTDFNGNELPDLDDSYNLIYPKIPNGVGVSFYLLYGGSAEIEINYVDLIEN